MKIIIHAGMHKTGTTALQVLLDRAREDMEEKGAKYFFVPKDLPFLYSYIHPAAKKRNSSLEDSKKEFEEKVNGEKFDTVILSSEDFSAGLQPVSLWAEKAKKIRNVFSGYEDVEVFLLFRRQDDFFESAFQQRTKEGVNLNLSQTISKFPLAESMNWNEKFKEYKKSLGGGIKLSVFSYDALKKREGVIGGVCKFMGLDLSLDDLSSRHLNNNSSSNLMTRVFAEYGPVLSPDKQKLISEKLSLLEKKAGVKKVRILSPSQRKKIIGSYYDSNMELMSWSLNPDFSVINEWAGEIGSERNTEVSDPDFSKELVRDLLDCLRFI